MRLRPIAAVILMHSEEFTDKAEIFEILYWWICDILLLGFLGKSIAALTGNTLFGTFLMTALITMRPTAARQGIIMAKLIVDELSGRMFMATFATPISRTEWLIAGMIVSFLQALMRLCLGYTLIYLFFGMNVFDLGTTFFLTLPFFILTGWVVGLFTSTWVYLFGKRYMNQLRAISTTFIALCGVFAPVSTLPHVLQKISWCLPATYILTGLREHMLTGVSIWPFLLKSLELNTIYVLIALPLLYLAFRRAKQHGLAHLETK